MKRRIEPLREPQIKEVSGTCSVLTSCQKLLLKSNVKRESLVESTCIV